MSTALEIAKAIIAKNPRETGRNTDHGGIIDKVLQEVGLPPGNSWCAAFVSHCFRAAGAGQHFPYSASSQAIMRWFKERDLFTYNAQDILKWNGAIGGWTEEDDPAHGHIFLIGGRKTLKFGSTLKLKSVLTEEGNTGPGGERNGDGAYSRTRQVPVDLGHKLWFLNCEKIPGGRFWN